MHFDPEDILEARADAEELMVDSCTVRRPTDQRTTDPVTGKVTVATSLVYPMAGGSGKCRLKQTGGQGNLAVAGDQAFTLLGSEAHFPYDAGPFRVGDVIEVTASLFTPWNVGKLLRIKQTMNQSMASAQRLQVEEVVT